MPSGYTEQVNDGTVTELEPFLLSCARAFGACIMQRDDPSSEPPKPQAIDNYHLLRKSDAEKKLCLLKKMTAAEASEKAKKEYEKDMVDYERFIQRNKLVMKRYQNMTTLVRGWMPPSPDHEGLKKFMLEQLEESTKWDVHTPTVPTILTGKKWLLNHLANAVRDVTYHTEEYEKEVERTTSRNEWIAKLYASLR